MIIAITRLVATVRRSSGKFDINKVRVSQMKWCVYTCVYVKWWWRRAKETEKKSLVFLVEQNAVLDMKQTNAVNLHKQYKMKCNRFSLCYFSTFFALNRSRLRWYRRWSSIFMDCMRKKGKETSCELESMWNFLCCFQSIACDSFK